MCIRDRAGAARPIVSGRKCPGGEVDPSGAAALSRAGPPSQGARRRGVRRNHRSEWKHPTIACAQRPSHADPERSRSGSAVDLPSDHSQRKSRGGENHDRGALHTLGQMSYSGGSEPKYAEIAIISSSESLATTFFINAVAVPALEPFCIVINCRAIYTGCSPAS